MVGWGNFLGGLMNKLPIQNRVERWKNQIDKLERERDELLKQPSTDANSKRMSAINDELSRVWLLLKNKASE